MTTSTINSKIADMVTSAIPAQGLERCLSMSIEEIKRLSQAEFNNSETGQLQRMNERLNRKVDRYKAENMRLSKECNEMEKENDTLQKEFLSEMKALNLKIDRLEHEKYKMQKVNDRLNDSLQSIQGTTHRRLVNTRH